MSFIVSKILWTFLAPGTFLVLLLVAGAFLNVSHDARLSKIGRRLTFVVAFVLFLIAIFPVGEWMLLPLENRIAPQKPEHVAGLILLGGDEKPQLSEKRGAPVYLGSGRRYIAFATLARQYPQAKLLYTGGDPVFRPRSGMNNADVAKDILAGLGLPVSQMMFDGLSRDTHENAVMSFTLAQPKPDEVWLLVTSGFHMPRALATFRKAGWNVQPVVAGYLTSGTFSTRLEFNLGDHLTDMSYALHEYYGLLAYRFMGYTDTLWPKN